MKYNKIFDQTVFVFLTSLVLLFLCLIYVNPSNSATPIIFLPIIISWVLATSFIRLALRVGGIKSSKTTTSVSNIVVTVALFLLLLSGVGQLNVQDAIISILLASILVFYIRRIYQ